MSDRGCGPVQLDSALAEAPFLEPAESRFNIAEQGLQPGQSLRALALETIQFRAPDSNRAS